MQTVNCRKQSLLSTSHVFQLHDASTLFSQPFALPFSQYCCVQVVKNLEAGPPLVCKTAYLCRVAHITDSDGTVTFTTLPFTSPLLPRP